MKRLRRPTIGAKLVMICVVLFVLGTDRLEAQIPSDTITFERTASPQSLAVGEETTITLTLHGSPAEHCASVNAMPADIVLALDVSTSMDSENKLTAAKGAAGRFIENMDLAIDRVAVVAFSGSAFTIQPFTTDALAAQRSIDGLSVIDGTDISSGLVQAVSLLTSPGGQRGASQYIVLLSDGQGCEQDAQQAERFKSQGFRIFTISLGDDADRDLMARIASSSANHYHAPSAADLDTIYESIRFQITASVATSLVVFMSYSADSLELIPDTASPSAMVSGNVLTWAFPSLAGSQAISVSFSVRPIVPGAYYASPSAGVTYNSCSNHPYSFNQGPDALLQVGVPPTTPTIASPPSTSPCESEPLSNDCIQQVVCLGPIASPCTALGLPWWVCLLFLLLLLLVLLLWWLWRKRRRERNKGEWTPPALGEIRRPIKPDLPLLPDVPQLDPLPPTPRPRIRLPSVTLVVGLGGTGRGSLNALSTVLSETYREPPSTVRLLGIDVGPQDTNPADGTLVLPLDDGVYALASRLAEKGSDLPYLRAWYRAQLAMPDPQDKLHGRALRRLALFLHRSTIQERLSKELCELDCHPGQRVEIYLIASLGGATGGGLLADLAHLVRLEAAAQQFKPAVYGLFVLPDAHLSSLESSTQSQLRQSAFATWRELDRFQLVFDHEYPIVYDDEQTVRQGKLLERCYLLGPERDEAPSLTEVLPEHGLYPAIADVLVSWMDPAIRAAWDEVYSSADARLNDQQVLRGEALYNGLGSFVYVLPIEDLVEAVALDLASEAVSAQRSAPSFDPHQEALAFVEANGHDGVRNTVFLQNVGRLARLGSVQAASVAGEFGVGLVDLVQPYLDSAPNREAVPAIKALAGDYVIRAVRTSDGYASQRWIGLWPWLKQSLAGTQPAVDYGYDTVTRFLPEFEPIFAHLEAVDDWLRSCEDIHRTVFRQQLFLWLHKHLPYQPQQPGTSGPGPTQAFLRDLLSVLRHHQAAVEEALSPRLARLDKCRVETEQVQKALLQAAGGVLRLISTKRALLQGSIPVAAGGLLVWTVGLNLLLGLAAGATVGLALLYNDLFRRPQRFRSHIIELQEKYRLAEQDCLRAELEARFYQTWVRLAANLVAQVHRVEEPLIAWEALLSTPEVGVTPRLSRRQSDLEAARQARSSIRVRRYLADPETEAILRRRYLHPCTLDDALKRLVWHPTANDEWRLSIHGVQTHQPDLSDPAAGEMALLDLARAYVAPVRRARLAEILVELSTPENLAKEAGRNSVPLIRTDRFEQPVIEAHRFLCLDAAEHEEHFRAVLAALQKPATAVHTQQLVERAANPYRCAVLATLDLLCAAGLPSWRQCREAYSYLPSQDRQALHIFPAEAHAAKWESALRCIHLESRPFSPYACLSLEDERRARAFWLALGYGWIREDERLIGRTSRRWWALALPGREPVPLTEPGEKLPSLWEAVVRYVLNECGGPVDDIEQAAMDKEGMTPAARRAAADELEQTTDRYIAALRMASDTRAAELSLLMRLVLEDANRRLYEEEGILG